MAHSHRNIYLISAAGGNFGDDAIAIGWLSFLRRRYPEARIWCDVSDVSLFSTLLGTHFPALRVSLVDFFWSTVRRFSGSHWEAIRNTESLLALRQDLKLEALRALLSEGETTIHLVGGGYINSVWPHNFALLQMASDLKRACDARLVWTGASIVPSSELEIFDSYPALLSFDYISCRDPKSVDILKVSHPSTRFCADDFALCLKEGIFKLNNSIDGEGGLIINHQRDLYSSLGFQTSIEDLRIFLRERALARRVAFLIASPVSDSFSVEYLKFPGLRYSVIDYRSLWDGLIHGSLPMGPRDEVVSSRFHVHMLSSFLGIQGRYLSSGDYYDNKHQLLCDYYHSSWTQFGRDPKEHSMSERPEPLLGASWSELVSMKAREVDTLYP